MDRLTKEQRKKNMQANKSTGTKPEIMLAKTLFSRGHRYRKNDKKVFGRPDLTFKKIKLAVFGEGEFWHGKDWHERKNDHKTNQDFWIKKIEGNIDPDNEVNEELKKQGWTILRFWSKEIEKNLLSCVLKIENEIKALKMNFKEKISREDFMKFFRDDDKLNQLTVDDRVEIFTTILVGSSDITKELLDNILSDYSVSNLEIIDNGKK